jgi:hypothetical protein
VSKRKLDVDQISKLPFLTTSQVRLLAGNDANSTIRRSWLKPVGRRGRSYIYDRESVMRWLSGEPAPPEKTDASVRCSGPASSMEDALTKIRAIARPR